MYTLKSENHTFALKKERFPRITKEQIPNPAQSWEFAHSLIAHSLIAHLLISLKSNEQLWAIRSDRLRQMSDHERIAQDAQDKWATVNDLLRLFRGNEQMSDSLKNFG